MKKPSPVIIVGCMFMILLVLSFYFTIIKQTDLDSKYPYKLRLYYSRIDGIREGTEVYLNGTLFGTVDKFKPISIQDVPDKRFLESGKESAIEVILKTKEPLTLWNNYQVRFKNITMFSGRTIEIDPGSYTDESSTYFHPSYSLQSKIPDFSPSANYYDDFFASANLLIQENRPDLRISVNNLTHVSTKLKYGSGTLPQIINNDIIYNALVETVSDLDIIGKEARRYQEGIRETSIAPIPFTINLYRRQTSIGKISSKLYDTAPKTKATKNFY